MSISSYSFPHTPAPPPGQETAPDMLQLLETLKQEHEDIQVIKEHAANLGTQQDKAGIYKKIDGK